VKALVTGAAGFAGRHLVETLASAGHEVLATGLERDAPPGLAGARWAALDVTDAGACRELLAAELPDGLVHLAGFAHVALAEQQPDACLALNFGGTRTLLEAALAVSPTTRVVLASSAEVYGRVPEAELPVTEERPPRPSTLYGVSKLAAEAAGQHAAARGLALIVARPFNHIGPGQSADFAAAAFARQIARAEAGLQSPRLSVGNLAAVRDLSDVRDIARGYCALLLHGRPGEAYNLTSGRAVAIAELLERLIAEARIPVTVEVDPARLRPLDLPVFHGSGAKALRETGYRAALDLQRTVADVLDDWRGRVASGE